MSIQDYADLYEKYGNQYGVDPALLMAQGEAESSGNPNAVGPDTKYGRASGLAQFIPATAKSLGITDPTDPDQAIRGQAQLMAENLKRYKDVDKALKAYHGGTNEDNWGPKTNSYPENVFKHYKGKQLASNDTIMSDASNDPLTEALMGRSTEKTEASSEQLDPLTEALSSRSKDSMVSPETKVSDKTPGYVEDVAKSVPTAVVRGVGAIPQIPAYAGNLAAQTEGYLYGRAHNLFSSNPYSQQQLDKLANVEPFFTGNTPADAYLQTGNALFGRAAPKNPISGDVLYEPKTAPGRLTSAAIEGAIAGPATGSAGPIKSALSAVGGAGANELFPNNPVAMIAGGLIAPGVAKAGNYLAGETSPELAQVAQDAKERGINIPPGLMTQNPLTQRAYSLLNRLGFTPDNTHEEFTSAAAKLLPQLEGEDKLTNPVMADAKSEITKGYGQVADMAEKSGGTKVSTSTLNAINDMAENAVEASPAIEKFKNQLIKAQDENGMLSGAQYKKLTQTGSVIDNMQNSTKPEIKIAGQQLERMLLNDLSESAGPEAKNLLQQTDKQYALWHLLDSARDDTTGLVNPTKFSSEAWKRNADYFKTQRNLRNPSETYKLSQIADQLKLTPSSGTAENLLLERLGGAAGSTLLGYGAAGTPGAIGAIGGGYLAGKIAGKALSSDTYRDYLIRKALGSEAP